MQAYTLTVGERQFRLRTPLDVSEFTGRLIASIREGGGMVDLPVAGEAVVSVLVSPGICVVLETREVDELVGADPADPVSWSGIDELDL